jgi:protein involved in polysaccharide export with SLBB domain
LFRAGALALVVTYAVGVPQAQAQQAAQDGSGAAATSGPVRLRQSASPMPSVSQERLERQDIDAAEGNDSLGDPSTEVERGRSTTRQPGGAVRPAAAAPAPAPLDEFEQYVRKLNTSVTSVDGSSTAPPPIRRFGAELFSGRNSFEAAENNAQVPADYVVGTGDELQISLWGSVDADLRAVVDRSGRISIPRVGTIMVAGTRYAELPDLISRRVGQVFRNFQLSVSLGQVRTVRVYVTGYVKRPGAYTVSSLSTLVNALMRSGGPTGSGSMRAIELRRGKDVVTRYDLYDLLLRGDRSADRTLQAGDVVHVGPVGTQVAMIGSVNKPAIFELRSGEKISSVLALAGGFTAVADRTRLAIERLDDRVKNRITQLSLPDDQEQVPQSGDVLRAFSAVEAAQPVARQNKRVRIEGEVARPGEYVLPPGVTTRMALGLAGGLTPNAYLFGTEFTRESVRMTQQQNYDRALRDLEVEFTRASATQRAINADEAATFEQRSAATARLIENLRRVRPTGRVVLQLEPASTELPDLPLEDGDRVYVPPRPTTVGVFGSVFNSGAFLLEPGKSIGDFLAQAGGPTRGADAGSTFVLRPNGSVLSQLQRSSFFGLVGGLNGVKAEPGDTVFVPEMMNKTTWVQDLKEWTQILYQFGIGAAALKTLKN